MAAPSVRIQPEEKRTKNFNEVSLGYSKKLAAEESRRCPQCADPVCIQGCPLGINIPGFIRLLREGNIDGAYNTIKEQSCLPAVCGRICSAPCEVACILADDDAPIGVRALERYVADHKKTRVSGRIISRRGKKIAIVGSGPAGLAAANSLAQKGYQVTIFESLDKPGGILRYGIPEFRIPKKVLDQEINDIIHQGVEIKTNIFVGQTMTFDELFKDGFAAILLAMGAGVPKFMDLKGSNLGGVYYGEEFLMRVNLSKSNLFSRHIPNFVMGQKVVVIGSGNTALDCARAAARFDRDVTLLFRRTEDEMRVSNDERSYGKTEGVRFEPLVRPIEILSDQNDFVGGLKCIRMDYADADKTGEWELMEVPNSEFILETDTVIIAIGHKPNSFISKLSLDLDLNRDGTIQVDEETGLTSVDAVFASGNIVTNAGPVVEAIAAGKKAAEQINEFLVK